MRLADSARELQRVIRAANGFPPGFPEDEIVALAGALEDAPQADPAVRLEAAIYVRERFVDCRRRFVSEAPDDPELPGIDAIAHGLNNAIAELSTLVVAAGRGAEARATPEHAGETSVATESARADADEIQRGAGRATDLIQHVEAELRSVPPQIYNIDQSRHYHFLNFSVSVQQLKLSVELIGAIFKGDFFDRAWLERLTASLEEKRAQFKDAWEEVRAFLERFRAIVDAVGRLSQQLSDLIRLVSEVARRVLRPRTASPAPGTIFKDIDAPWCPEMVVIPPGSFLMGSPDDERGRRSDEGPQHLITIARPFALGRYPVSFEEYDYFCAETGREKPKDEEWGRGRRPVINVPWQHAQNYCQWLSEVTRQQYRLPSEAEWEYACRAGTTTRFWTGETISADHANFGGAPSGGGVSAWGGVRPWGSGPWGSGAYGRGAQGNVRGQTTPVDTFRANPWKLHDMHGNVWEWNEDCWKENYEKAPMDGSAWLSGDSSVRALRGGSWYDRPDDLRSAKRYAAYWGASGNVIGLRIARTCDP